MPAPARDQFLYAVIRIVPRVERGERFNAGVVLFCRPRRYLAARTWLDEPLLRALAPDLSAGDVQPHLDALIQIAAGNPAAGPIARLSHAERFYWLTAPSSSIIQPSPVHTGLSDDPATLLDHLFETLVARGT